MAVVRSPDFLRALNQRDCACNCACNIDPPASSYAIMRRAGPYRGENSGPGKDDRGELDTETRNQRTKSALSDGSHFDRRRSLSGRSGQRLGPQWSLMTPTETCAVEECCSATLCRRYFASVLQLRLAKRIEQAVVEDWVRATPGRPHLIRRGTITPPPAGLSPASPAAAATERGHGASGPAERRRWAP